MQYHATSSFRAFFRRPAAALAAALVVLLSASTPVVDGQAVILTVVHSESGETAASLHRLVHQIPAEPSVTKHTRPVAPVEASGTDWTSGITAYAGAAFAGRGFGKVGTLLAGLPDRTGTPLFCLHCAYLI